jgi:hypothetical protein
VKRPSHSGSKSGCVPVDVAPQDAGLAVGIEVAGPGDLIARWHDAEVLVGKAARAVRVPNLGVAVRIDTKTRNRRSAPFAKIGGLIKSSAL